MISVACARKGAPCARDRCGCGRRAQSRRDVHYHRRPPRRDARPALREPSVCRSTNVLDTAVPACHIFGLTIVRPDDHSHRAYRARRVNVRDLRGRRVLRRRVRILYNLDAARRPTVVGRRDEEGAALLPSHGEITPVLVANAIFSRLARRGGDGPRLRGRLARLSFERVAAMPPARLERTPFFCSGCPHNTSTRLPEGSRAYAGIGCHGMAMLVPARRTTMGTRMGGEGATWIGQAPFTSEKHVFQKLGDGTYQHSGLLAIRAAAVAGVNITYKILYNDAVAMTGGQPVEPGKRRRSVSLAALGRHAATGRDRARARRASHQSSVPDGRGDDRRSRPLSGHRPSPPRDQEGGGFPNLWRWVALLAARPRVAKGMAGG